MKTTSARTAYCLQSTFALSADRFLLPILHSAICTLPSPSRRPCSAGLLTCESTFGRTDNNQLLQNQKPSKEKCYPCARVLPMCQGESVTFVSEHSAHSRNPCCTAVFCTVPPPQFSKRTSRLGNHFRGGAGSATQIFSTNHTFPPSRRLTFVDFSPQVPDLTLFNPF